MSLDQSPPVPAGTERSYPPIGWLSTGALASVIIGGILMASYAPRKAPLGAAAALLVVGALLLLSAGVLLASLKEFSRTTFLKVFKWAIFADLVTAAMIEFAFVRDHTNGASLLIVTCMLAVFTLSVPTTIAFTVARYAED
jgi:type III secretory pathway component EscS